MNPLTISIILLFTVGSVLGADTVTSGLGPETVLQESGYISVPGSRQDNGTHLWYWFFESRSNPLTDPLVLWLTGGPGCSSLAALFGENGPYIINPSNLALSLNPHSWNSKANVIWLDQPVGTGFSYADSILDSDVNEDQVADDLYNFIQIFLQRHPKYRQLPFYVTGESYAGHYNAAFSALIVNRLKDPSYPLINFKGTAIGNGWVNPKIQYGSFADFMWNNNMISYWERLKVNKLYYPICKSLISRFPVLASPACQFIMQGVLSSAEESLGHSINVYDIRGPCKTPPLCYDFSYIERFLLLDGVKQSLGVNPSVSWAECSKTVHVLLFGDFNHDFSDRIATVLEAGFRVLIYSGQYDYICNSLGSHQWLSQLSWSGQDGFVSAPHFDWKVNGNIVGGGYSYKNLTWLEVNDAGHMVPMDQPENSLQMINIFLSN